MLPDWHSAARLGLVVVVAALATLTRPATATSPYLFVPADEVREASPTYRYANMSDEEALAELDRRGVPYTKLDRVRGVRAPVRLTGRLHGVHVHSSLPEEKRADSLFEILDARLALALDDFCALLARHDIVEVVHYTMNRPNGPSPAQRSAAKQQDRKRSRKKGARKGRRGKGSLGKAKRGAKRGGSAKRSKRKQKAGKTKGKPPLSKKANKRRSAKKRGHNKGRKGRRAATREVKKRTYAPPGTRHPAGLAIDVGGLKKRDGRWLMVSHHFEGRVGTKTCGPDVDPPKSTEARELWSIVCEAADLGLFTYVLTPNFDKWHADHFHMEIRGDVRWFLYH